MIGDLPTCTDFLENPQDLRRTEGCILTAEMPVPQTLGPYRVVRPLGKGGMSTVLLAEDTRLGRQVALKTISGADADTAYSREHLLREARAVAALSHPNIATVHDVLDTDGQIVIVFEYIEGDTLATRLEKGRLPIDSALSIALQLTEALRAAHDRGIIHRDLKPANVAIAPDGVVKVLDFGIARTVPREASTNTNLRTTASFTGTIGYAPPEQCLGQPADARADIFSLAVVLYEMLAGDRPFPGRDATTVVRAMLEGEAPHISSVVPGIPPPLDDLLARALARDPARRPQTAGEFREGLRAHLPTGPIPIVLPRPRRVWALVAMLVAAVGVGALLWSIGSAPSVSSRPANVQVPVVAVMPLTNASGDSSNDYLALGVADNLITRLASLPSVTVLSRSAVADARSRARGLSALATELDATYLVDGSVQQAGNQLRINLNLVRDDASVAWAETVEGSFDQIFALQTRLASVLAEALEVQLSAADRETLAQQPTLNSDALAAYWRGRTLLERRDIKGNTSAALRAFDEAVGLDPRFADAHAARGEALWALYLETKDPAIANSALDAGVTALRIDPNRANVRYSLALSLAGNGRLTEAVEELQHALRLQPNYDDARRELGSVLARQGKTDEAVAELRKAIALRPSFWGHYSTLGLRLYQAARYDEAAEAFTRVIQLQPDNFIGYQQLGTVYQAVGRDVEALANYQRATAIRPSGPAYSNIGTLHYRRGEFSQAVDAYRAALKIRPNSASTYGNLGDALGRLGRATDARAAYREAVRLAEADLKVNPRDAVTLAGLGMFAAKAGDPAASRRHLDVALRIAPDDIQVLFSAAKAFAILGQIEDAMDALERAVKGGFGRTSLAETDEFESLRGTQRFQALIRNASPPGGVPR